MNFPQKSETKLPVSKYAKHLWTDRIVDVKHGSGA